MPNFLEQRLRQEYGNDKHAIYGTMNAIGAMRGNKETAKGREMERKHEMKTEKEAASPMREMRIEIHRGPKNEVTGHTVHHHLMPTKASKSGAFMEETHHSFPFDGDGESSTHGNMMEHIGKHLGVSSYADDEGEGSDKSE
jgi:hypothetical protein